MGERVLVLGGGVGGLVAASRMRRKLSKEHDVVLIDRDGVHVFWPSLLWLLIGRRQPGKIVRDLSRLNKQGIQVIQGTLEEIDPDRKTVRVDGNELAGDYLVVSLGARLAPELIPGLGESGHNLYSVEGAASANAQRKDIVKGRIVVLVAGMPFKCPAAPYEAAMLVEHDLRRRKVRGNVSLALYTPEAGPMGVAGPDVSAGVLGMVEGRNIEYYPQHQVERVDAGKRTIHFEKGSQISYDMLVYVPPHVAPDVVLKSRLKGPGGWISVDPHTMKTQFSGVYAIGDVTNIPLTMGLPLPKAGVFAHHQAMAVTQSISSKISGDRKEGRFEGQGECFIEVGGGKAGFGKGNFYAQPSPKIKLYKPGWHWHGLKLWYEKHWLSQWF